MENVPGVLKHIWGRIIKLGGRAHILNAAHYGTPQLKKRVFCGRFPFPPHTHAKQAHLTLTGKLVKWITVAEALKDVELPGDENLAITEKAFERIKAILRKDKVDYYVPVISGDKPVHTIRANIGKDFSTGGIIDSSFYDRHGSNFFPDGHPSPVLTTKVGRLHILKENLRRLSTVEAKILMGFPKDYIILGTSIASKFKQIGNAVCPPVAKAIAEKIKEVA